MEPANIAHEPGSLPVLSAQATRILWLTMYTAYASRLPRYAIPSGLETARSGADQLLHGVLSLSLSAGAGRWRHLSPSAGTLQWPEGWCAEDLRLRHVSPSKQQGQACVDSSAAYPAAAIARSSDIGQHNSPQLEPLRAVASAPSGGPAYPPTSSRSEQLQSLVRSHCPLQPSCTVFPKRVSGYPGADIQARWRQQS